MVAAEADGIDPRLGSGADRFGLFDWFLCIMINLAECGVFSIKKVQKVITISIKINLMIEEIFIYEEEAK